MTWMRSSPGCAVSLQKNSFNAAVGRSLGAPFLFADNSPDFHDRTSTTWRESKDRAPAVEPACIARCLGFEKRSRLFGGEAISAFELSSPPPPALAANIVADRLLLCSQYVWGGAIPDEITQDNRRPGGALCASIAEVWGAEAWDGTRWGLSLRGMIILLPSSKHFILARQIRPTGHRHRTRSPSFSMT